MSNSQEQHPDGMRPSLKTDVFTFLIRFAAIVLAATALIWIVAYLRIVGPMAMDYLPTGEFSFLSFPQIKIYRVADPTTGTLSDSRLDFFNMADGPTGIEYTEHCFPSWIGSILALVVLIAAIGFLAASSRRKSANGAE